MLGAQLAVKNSAYYNICNIVAKSKLDF